MMEAIKMHGKRNSSSKNKSCLGRKIRRMCEISTNILNSKCELRMMMLSVIAYSLCQRSFDLLRSFSLMFVHQSTAVLPNHKETQYSETRENNAKSEIASKRNLLETSERAKMIRSKRVNHFSETGTLTDNVNEMEFVLNDE